MKIQNTNPYSQQSFGKLRRNPLTVSEDVYYSLKKLPVIDNFSKKYNSVVSLRPFVSSRDSERIQLALYFSHVKPKNIFERFINKFKSSKCDEVILKTRAVNEPEMYMELEKVSKNRLIDIYKNNK